MQFKDLLALNVKLPKIETAGSNLIKNELIISVSKNGLYTVDSQKVSIDKLQKYFPQPLLQKKPTVLVVADEDSALKYVTEVDLCRKTALKISSSGEVKFKIQGKKGLTFFPLPQLYRPVPYKTVSSGNS